MKITSVDIFLLKTPVPKDWEFPVASFVSGGSALIRVNTDQGISGWGEPSPYGAPIETTLKTIQNEVRPFLIGKDPRNVRTITKQDEIKSKHVYGEAAWSSALAGVSQALWDIVGKAEGKPLYQLLNRKDEVSNKVPVYASGGMIYDDSPLELLIEEALSAKEQGYQFWKFRPTSPVSNLSHFERNKNPPAINIDQIIQLSQKLRITLGDDFGLMIDVGCRIPDQENALKMGKAFDELNFHFFEEPVKRNIEDYQYLTKKLSTPIGTGECFFSVEQFKRWVDADALDILQPDANFAGITDILLIADLAKKHQKEMILHNWTNAVSMAANAHLACAIPECTMLEYSIIYNPMRSELINTPFKVESGELSLPDAPGLGIEIDKKALDRFCYFKD
jgi:L-alanine-DL-glutamate epimerase-like enolase superfamily enzyme